MKIDVCDIAILTIDNLTLKEFRVKVKEWLKSNYINKTYVNIETGFEIIINKTCIDKLISSIGEIKAHAYTVIPLLIKNAIFIKAENDNRDRPDFICTLNFKSLVEIDKNVYEVWFYVRQTTKQYFLYSININSKDIKK